MQAACNAVAISRQALYAHKKKNPDFAEEWSSAIDAGSDKLEDEALRRAHDGVDEPVFYQGEIVGHVRKYSDTLLMFLLKGRRPQKYRDHLRAEVTGKDGEPIVTEIRRVVVDPRNQDA